VRVSSVIMHTTLHLSLFLSIGLISWL